LNPELRQQFQAWVSEHKALAQILAAGLLFSLGMGLAKLFGDFHFYYNNDIPGEYLYTITIKVGGLALLSIVNVYAVRPLINWYDAGGLPPALKLAITGILFGSIFCSVVGVVVGLAFALFLALTLIRMLVGR